MVFEKILCGGTFDKLHNGHKAFLRFAFTKGRHIVIGITSDTYVARHKSNQAFSIEPFAQRKKEVVAFLTTEGFLARASIVRIMNPFDKTQKDTRNTALLVSTETYPHGQMINDERKKKGLSQLPLIVFPVILATNGTRISSTSIRKGIITKSGEMLTALPSQTCIVSQPIRKLLHKPCGTLFYKEIPQEYLEYPEKLVTVGDVTTKRIHDMGIKQAYAVIDFFVERKKTYNKIAELGFTGYESVVHIINPAGQLQASVWQLLRDSVDTIHRRKYTVVVVDGEEDLLVIPLIILLPVGFVILYGQPREGVVAVEVTKKLQEQIRAILVYLKGNNTPGY